MLDAATAFACTTCDPTLRAAIFDEGFAGNLVRVLALLIGLVVVTTWTAQRAAAALDRALAPGLSPISPVVTAGTLLGLGMGGFVDGILLHQLLQWHQMMSSVLDPTTVQAKSVNMFWDGLFHAGTWVTTALGIAALWRVAAHPIAVKSTPVLLGAAWLGWGGFNVIEGVFDHLVFRFHDVRELSDAPMAWNVGFLVVGAIQVATGWLVIRQGARTALHAQQTR